MRNGMALAAMAIAGCCGFTVSGQPRVTTGPFTAEQSAAGRTAYQANCSGCHGPELAGRNEAPQLAGNNFMNAWGGRTIQDLVTYIRTTMPPGVPNSLPEATYVGVAAF